MEIIVAKPTNREQLAALKAIMKALKIDFFIEKNPYSQEFLAKIERAEQQMKSGRYRKITVSEIL
jgi:hypothetical protein